MKLHSQTKLIECIDENQDTNVYKRQLACCLILTQNNKILLQKRSKQRKSFPEHISTFGGAINTNEQPIQAVIRELHEELGAVVDSNDLISFGAITEAITAHTEIIHVYFWHDKHGSITGCYEDTPLYCENIQAASSLPKVMDYVVWLLEQCRINGLLQ